MPDSESLGALLDQNAMDVEDELVKLMYVITMYLLLIGNNTVDLQVKPSTTVVARKLVA